MSDAQDPPLYARNVIAWKDLKVQPWRNGGGVTRQILSARRSGSGNWMPAEEERDWRLSIADVDDAGAFSSFPGMTRILTVIDGTSVTLTVDGRVEELERHRPFTFDGSADTSAVLPHGPIRDLNLMARTGAVDAEVLIENLTAGSPRLVSDGQYCVMIEGRAQLTLNSATSSTSSTSASVEVKLERFDTALGSDSHSPIITGEGILAVIMISRGVEGEGEVEPHLLH